MKNQFSTITVIVAVGFAALLAAAPAGAQTSETRFHVPFTFLAGNRMHPAGQYVVRLDPAYHVMELRRVNTADLERIPLESAPVPRAAGKPMPSTLTFRKYGSYHALRGVWAAGDRDGFELTLSRAEEKLARANGGAAAGEDAVFNR